MRAKARWRMDSMSSVVSLERVKTRHLDKRAFWTLNEGFSVVAPGIVLEFLLTC